jgi:hypothetical protein
MWLLAVVPWETQRLGQTTVLLAVMPATDRGVQHVTTRTNRIVMGNNSHTNAYITIAWTVTSDARDKTSIESCPAWINFCKQLNPVSYRWKTSREDDTPHGNKRYGFLAQDILQLEGDNPVIIDNETPEHLKYQGESLVPVLINAIKELSAKCDSLQSEINTSERTIMELTAEQIAPALLCCYGQR